MSRPVAVVVSCEHGGNRVPARYRTLFRGHEALLASHRGFDAGALALARQLAGALDAPLIASTTTRLLVDLNRSEHHRSVFSPITRGLEGAVRQRILADHYHPYRARVESTIVRALDRGRRVVHLSAHSFTPVLDGEVRGADVGLLYDPARRSERRWSSRIGAAITDRTSQLRVRRNYPYRGANDGLTTTLRRRFRDADYCGIEIEINQARVVDRPVWRLLRRAIVHAFQDLLDDAVRT
jgi:predicted N-formylglutamate amidohydrolase